MHSLSITQALFMAQQGRCFYCSVVFEGPFKAKTDKGWAHLLRARCWTKDHLVPKSKGGKEVLNLILSCACCNNTKGARMPTIDEIARAEIVHAACAALVMGYTGYVINNWGDIPTPLGAPPNDKLKNYYNGIRRRSGLPENGEPVR